MSENEVAINELIEFLTHERSDVRKTAFQVVSQQSGNAAFLSSLSQKSTALSIIIDGLKEGASKNNSCIPLLPFIFTTLTNISTSVTGTNACLSTEGKKLITSLVSIIRERESPYSDCACGLLANLTRSSVCCSKVLEYINEEKNTFPALLIVATSTGYNTSGNSLDLLMNVVENISQLKEGRELLLNRERNMIQRILPFTQYSKSESRRRASVACLYNCCFNKDDHLWLLSSKVDLSSYLCLSLLAGGDEFRDDELEDLSDMLLYPDDEKTREPSEQIRLMIVQALTQLCATKAAREELRKQSIYSVLREYHKWEKSGQLLPLLEDLINILIKKEEEIGHDDLTEVEVPEEMAEKFQRMDMDNKEAEEVESDK